MPNGECPECGQITAIPSSTWRMKGNNQKKGVTIEQYRCGRCGKSFREGVPDQE